MVGLRLVGVGVGQYRGIWELGDWYVEGCQPLLHAKWGVAWHRLLLDCPGYVYVLGISR